MPKRSDRTSKKRKYTTPGGLKKVEYHKRKHSKHYCGRCSVELSGVPTQIKGLSKSKKAPNRPYGGVYCSNCSRIVIRKKVMESGKI